MSIPPKKNFVGHFGNFLLFLNLFKGLLINFVKFEYFIVVHAIILKVSSCDLLVRCSLSPTVVFGLLIKKKAIKMILKN